MAVLIDGDATSFSAALYGRPREETVRFLQQQFDDPSRAMNFANNSFVERSRKVFEVNFSDEAMAKYDAVSRSLRRIWDVDGIRELTTVEEFQNAKPTMQRFIMANPFIRSRFKEGRLAGYGDLYVDHKKQGVGEDHYDWRLARSGFATFNDEDGWVATTYGDELLEGDTRPTFLDQIDIDRTWANAEALLLFGSRDITDVENGEWG